MGGFLICEFGSEIPFYVDQITSKMGRGRLEGLDLGVVGGILSFHLSYVLAVDEHLLKHLSLSVIQVPAM